MATQPVTPSFSLSALVTKLLFACLCLLLVFALGARVAMQWLPDIAHQLEEHLEQRLSIDLHINHVKGEMRGFFPVISLQGLQLVPTDKGASPFVIKNASITVNPWRSLWRRSLQLEELTLSGASLHLVVDEQGRVRLRGQSDDTERATFNPEQLRSVLRIAYDQKNVVVQNIQLRFDFSEQPSITSDNAQLVLSKQGNQRLLMVDFKASNHALSFSTRLNLTRHAYAIDELAGGLYLSLEGERLERWLPEQWPLDLVPARLGGKVELWGELRQGGIAESTLALSQAELSLIHRQQSGFWSLDNAAIIARGQRTAAGYALQVESVVGNNENAGLLDAGPIWLEATEEAPKEWQWRLRGENISLSGLARHIKAWPFPLPEPVPQVLKQSPEGGVSEFLVSGKDYQWHRAAARFADVAMGAESKPVSASGLAGWVAASPKAGVAHIEPSVLSLGFPALYEHSLIGEVQGSVHWRQGSEGYELTTGRVQVKNQDAVGDALLKLTFPEDELPYLQLRAEVSQGRVSRAATYIPLRKIPPAASQWLEEAFVGGELERGRFLYEGTVKPALDMPWQRTFLMTFATESAELHLAPGWPTLRQIRGEVEINGAEVTGDNLGAHYLGQSLQNISLDISPQFERTQLLAKGRFDGEAQALNRLFTQTPLAQQVPEALQQWQVGAGNAAGTLALAIPLAPKAPPLAVEVGAHFNQLAYGSQTLGFEATRLSGSAAFSLAEGLRIPAFTGRLFGQEVSGRVSSSDNHTQLSLSGDMPLKALREWRKEAWLAHAWGQANYLFSLNIPRGGNGSVNWQVYSDLHGVGVDLPPPLHKSSKEKLPLTLSWHPEKQGQRLVVRSSLLQSELLFGEQELLRGALYFGGGNFTLPSQGFAITGEVAHLDGVAWQQWLTQNADTQGKTPWPKIELALEAKDISLGGLGRVGAGTLGFSQDTNAWQLQLQSEQLSGELWVPNDYQQRGNRPLTLHVDKFVWPFKRKALSSVALPVSITPTTMPVADVRLNQVEFEGKSLGRWQAQFRPVDDGILLDALQGRWLGTTLLGQLHWREASNGQRSELTADIDSQDLGALFRELGLPSFIESKQTSSQWDIAWQGAPWELDYQQLNGDVSVRVDKAFFPTSDKRTSALRMLGVLNVGHTLGRRLRLDFSDVMQKGLAVDKLTGDYRFQGPKIFSTNAQILSPSAEFNMAGAIDLANGEIDSGIEVTVPLSSNLYAGCFAGPAACAGVFVVERLWGNRLEKMTSMEYHAFGSWNNPTVKDVNGIYVKKRQQYAY